MMMIGIDPHKGSHTAVVIDPDERVVDEIRVRTSTGQASELREWFRRIRIGPGLWSRLGGWVIWCLSSWWRLGSG